MFDPTAGAARVKISARRRFDDVELEAGRLAARDRLTKEEFETLQKSGTVIVDARRHRPLYFDGRFLSAADLVREQNYFLTRQADLGRAGGMGVVYGLLVEKGDAATEIRIQPGHGVTASGELVVLPSPLVLSFSNVATIQRLDSSFGLMKIPRESPRNPSGLFIVALRPVEFTANPIASYPTTLTGPRSVEDGDIVEGVAATLMPYPDAGAGDDLDRRRGRVARQIFLEGVPGSTMGHTLPLAMVALENGFLRWVDSFMVRREVGAQHGDVLGLGFAPRAAREAHVLQYEHHLENVLQQRGSQGERFAAADHFDALPPAGRIPRAAIDTTDFTQTYFPPELDVDLSIIPSDELPALLEESLLLPPIDLTLETAQLESTSVLVLVPVDRPKVRALRTTLSTPDGVANPLSRRLKTTAPGFVARRNPFEALIRIPRLPFPVPIPARLADTEWKKTVDEAETLWYVRRRNVHYKVQVAGVSVRVAGDDVREEEDMVNRIRDGGLLERFQRLRERGSIGAVAEMKAILASPKFEASKLLLNSVMMELETKTPAGEAPKIDRLSILKVGERFADPEFGEGIKRLEAANPELKDNETVINNLAKAGVVPELDALGRKLNDSERTALLSKVMEHARTGDTDKVGELIRNRMKEIGG